MASGNKNGLLIKHVHEQIEKFLLFSKNSMEKLCQIHEEILVNKYLNVKDDGHDFYFF